jgi:hypothetical protein
MTLKLMTAGLLTSALAFAFPASTQADIRVGVGVQLGVGYHDSRDAWQRGYARGRDEGYREGERDARRHERFDFYDERSYRDSDRGYKGWMGPRFVYERGYRQGYEEAYARAYRRFAHERWDRDDHRDRDGWGDRYDRDHR